MNGVFLITVTVLVTGSLPACGQSDRRRVSIPGRNEAQRLREQREDTPADSCRAAVKAHAAGRYGAPTIEFSEIRAEHPGRIDRVTGTFFLRRGPEPGEPHDFTCSVNPVNGRLRSVEIDRGGLGTRDRARIAVQSCRREVEDRMRSRGYGNVRFGTIGIEGREVLGTVRGEQGQAIESFEFGCRADAASSRILSVDVNRR